MLFLQTLLLISFPQFEALDLLSASQVAQLTLTSGALHNVGLIRLVLDRLEGSGSAFLEIDEFLTALISTTQVRSRHQDGGHQPVSFSGRQKNRQRLFCLPQCLMEMLLSVCLSCPLGLGHQSCGEGHLDGAHLRHHQPSL
ncbi:MAG: hypothetical protein ACRDAK_03795 [Aeromonas veronii]